MPNLRWVEKTNLPDLLRGVCAAPALLVQEIRALALGQLALIPPTATFCWSMSKGRRGRSRRRRRALFESPLPLSGELAMTPSGETDALWLRSGGLVETWFRAAVCSPVLPRRSARTAHLDALIPRLAAQGLRPGW